jgi:hypothetical protein
MNIDSQSISLQRADCPVGTTIRFSLNSNDSNRIARSIGKSGINISQWDWYCFDKPKVIFKMLPNDATYEQRYKLPFGNSDDNWNMFTFEGFAAILWTTIVDAPQLTCNGIRITKFTKKEVQLSGKISLNLPKIAVIDPDGNLPLTLQRTELMSDQLPFQTKLIEEVFLHFTRDLVKSILVRGYSLAQLNTSITLSNEQYGINFGVRNKKRRTVARFSPIIWTSTGFTIFSQRMIQALDLKSLIFIPRHVIDSVNIQGMLTNIVGYIIEDQKSTRFHLALLRVCLFLAGSHTNFEYGLGLNNLSISGRVVILPRFAFKVNLKKYGFSSDGLNKFTILKETDNYLLLKLGNQNVTNSQLYTFFDSIETLNVGDYFFASEYMIENSGEIITHELVDDSWTKVFGGNTVPLDPPSLHRVLSIT